MDRNEIAKQIFIMMAQGTNPARDVPVTILERSARMAFRAADVFVKVQEEHEKEEA